MGFSDGWHLEVGMRSETGRIRSTNQDSGYGDALMAVIADGVGGGPSGDIASATVVRTLVDQLDCRLGDPEQVRSVIAMANSELTSLMRHDPSLNGMATTLTALVPLGDQLGVVHIGDSRAYVFRGDQSAQVTRDDSLVRLMVENGQLSRDEAATHPMRNLLLHSLAGSLSDPDFVALRPVNVVDGDRWLLTTDGLSDYLPGGITTSLARSVSDPQEAADALVEAALPLSKDNISVVVVDVHAGVGGETLGRFCGSAASPGRRLAVS